VHFVIVTSVRCGAFVSIDFVVVSHNFLLICCRIYFVCVSQATLSRQPLCRALSLLQSLRALILLCSCVPRFLLFDPRVKLSEVFINRLIFWFDLISKKDCQFGSSPNDVFIYCRLCNIVIHPKCTGLVGRVKDYNDLRFGFSWTCALVQHNQPCLCFKSSVYV